MVNDQTDGDIFLLVCLIFCMSKFTYTVTKRLHRIYVKDRINILNNCCQTFQTHTCIDILHFQKFVVAVSVIFKLCKYVVPYFDVSVTVTSYCTVRFSTAVFFTAVIINLRTRTAGTGTMLPEVVSFSKTENAFFRNTDLFMPDIPCFIIFQIY